MDSKRPPDKKTGAEKIIDEALTGVGLAVEDTAAFVTGEAPANIDITDSAAQEDAIQTQAAIDALGADSGKPEFTLDNMTAAIAAKMAPTPAAAAPPPTNATAEVPSGVDDTVAGIDGRASGAQVDPEGDVTSFAPAVAPGKAPQRRSVRLSTPRAPDVGDPVDDEMASPTPTTFAPTETDAPDDNHFMTFDEQDDLSPREQVNQQVNDLIAELENEKKIMEALQQEKGNLPETSAIASNQAQIEIIAIQDKLRAILKDPMHPITEIQEGIKEAQLAIIKNHQEIFAVTFSARISANPTAPASSITTPSGAQPAPPETIVSSRPPEPSEITPASGRSMPTASTHYNFSPPSPKLNAEEKKFIKKNTRVFIERAQAFSGLLAELKEGGDTDQLKQAIAKAVSMKEQAEKFVKNYADRHDLNENRVEFLKGMNTAIAALTASIQYAREETANLVIHFSDHAKKFPVTDTNDVQRILQQEADKYIRGTASPSSISPAGTINATSVITAGEVKINYNEVEGVGKYVSAQYKRQDGGHVSEFVMRATGTLAATKGKGDVSVPHDSLLAVALTEVSNYVNAVKADPNYNSELPISIQVRGSPEQRKALAIAANYLSEKLDPNVKIQCSHPVADEKHKEKTMKLFDQRLGESEIIQRLPANLRRTNEQIKEQVALDQKETKRSWSPGRSGG